MITYKYKQVCISFSHIASVITEAHLWRGLPFAIIASVLAMYFRLYEEIEDRRWFRYEFMDAVVYKAVAAFTSFVVIFRIESAYSRFRRGCQMAYNINGDLFDAVSLLIAFCRNAKTTPDVVEAFQNKLVRLLSLLNAIIYSDLIGGKSNYEDLLKFQTLNVDGLDAKSLKVLASAPHKLELVFEWIQMLVQDHITMGTLNMPPPILTRFHEEAANAIVKIHECLSITEIPFPFPLATTAECLLFIYSAMTAVMMVEWTKYLGTAALFTYMLVSVVWFFNGIAAALENPFECQKHSLDTHDMQREFNEHLHVLLNPATQKVPKLTERAFRDPVWLNTRNSEGKMTSLRRSLMSVGSPGSTLPKRATFQSVRPSVATTAVDNASVSQPLSQAQERGSVVDRQPQPADPPAIALSAEEGEETLL